MYQLVGGYEAANDSNQLRHDPIYKIAWGCLPFAPAECLASQLTMTRLENQVSKAVLLTKGQTGYLILNIQGSGLKPARL